MSTDGEMASVVEFTTIIAFFNGVEPQLDEMTNFLIASFNGVQTLEGKDVLSFAEYVKTSSDPVIATSEFVKAVVVPIFPQSTSQDGGTSHGSKFISTTWILFLLVITPIVFATALYHARRFKSTCRYLQEKEKEKGKAEVEAMTAPSSPANVKAKQPLEFNVEADRSDDKDFCSEIYEGDMPVINVEYDGGSSILHCGASWLSDLFNYSSTGRSRERPLPLPELNFLNYVESPRDGPKYT